MISAVEKEITIQNELLSKIKWEKIKKSYILLIQISPPARL